MGVTAIQRIVNEFCQATGRSKLQPIEWRRIGHQVKLLMRKGYTEADILCAIQYAKQNVRNFYGFGIVSYVIDKARGIGPVPAANQVVACDEDAPSAPKSLLDEVVTAKTPLPSKPQWMKSNMEVV